ncbi:IS3 family transposase [Flaviflexus ciconiae]|uniref:IS3 family transposase n=1 Tax=Flaviflexus ciconiae TaxID=2496867 RepID=A0A3Q9G3E2_9ACTO|nr:IS3 family transposase [Flaviflexus ciconiae]
MIVAFIDTQRSKGHRVTQICDVLTGQGLRVSARTYRSWKTASPSQRDLDDAIIIDALLATVGTPEGMYGRRKMVAYLRRRGLVVSARRVDRLMGDLGMNGRVRGRGVRTTIPDRSAARAPDLVERDFTAPAPNERWVADFTYVRTWAGFVYVAFVIDCFSRAIVGWHASASMTTPLVANALRMGLWRRDQAGCPAGKGLIHHSDAGAQGGFNWLSQHLDRGGGQQWRRSSGLRRRARFLRGRGGSGVRIERCVRRCARLGGLSRRGRCSGSSGV